MENIFSDFRLREPVDKGILEKYKNIIPEDVIGIWQNYGFGSFLNGYLKVINPDEYMGILEESYFRKDVSIPIFATGMGDILTWEENQYLMLIKFRKGTIKGLSFKYFFSDLNEAEFREDELDCKQYDKAIEREGTIEYDECFGYTPLLGLGGEEKVDNLKKVKIKEHIYLITQLMGPIE
jgi:hypothetical protein